MTQPSQVSLMVLMTFTKVGSGTLTLSGDNSTASYTGRIIIDDGNSQLQQTVTLES
jgi:autotransporter-associated beta strand protein